VLGAAWVGVAVGGIVCVVAGALMLVCVLCHCGFQSSWSSAICGVICEVNGCCWSLVDGCLVV